MKGQRETSVRRIRDNKVSKIVKAVGDLLGILRGMRAASSLTCCYRQICMHTNESMPLYIFQSYLYIKDKLIKIFFNFYKWVVIIFLWVSVTRGGATLSPGCPIEHHSSKNYTIYTRKVLTYIGIYDILDMLK